MKPAAKIGLVIGGFIAAFGGASAVVALYVSLTDGPDRQTYGAMYAFGDSLLFLAVFGVFALVPSGAGLYFLRPFRPFWRFLTVAALLVAVTGLLAAVVYVAQRVVGGSALQAGAGVAVLRLLVAPLFAGGFLVSGVFAPGQVYRLALLGAMLVEVAVFLVLIVALRMSPVGV